MIFKAKSRAGAFAEQRYKRGLRSWRTTNRRLFAAMCAPLAVAGCAAVMVDRHFVAWIGGLVAGAAIALWVSLRDTPPRYVEKWHDGAEGERKTEKVLRPLERAGWRVFHEVENGHGNYDHIAVGRAGVLLLDSKNLEGIVEVEGGAPHLTRRHDPDENWVLDHIRPRILAAAAGLKEDIEQRTAQCTWVQAVVVFWSEFPEGLVEADKCVFIHGPLLREWMEARHEGLGHAQVDEIAAGIAGIAKQESVDAVVPVTPGLISA